MSNQQKNTTSRSESAAGELESLRHELEEVRVRLVEEASYYRAELEASRQRWDRDATRLQAEEVARRRRVEQELLRIKAELQQALEQSSLLQQQNKELNRALSELIATQAERERKALAAEREAAGQAWQEAEQEFERQERELDSAQRLIATLQSTHQDLLDEQASLRNDALRAQQTREDAERLVASLKKALWKTAHARRQAEIALISLRAETQAEHEVDDAATSEDAEAIIPLATSYNELSQEDLKVVFFGELSSELTDNFLLTTADASLDQETIEQLRTMAKPSPPAKRKETRQRPKAAQSPVQVLVEALPPKAPMRQGRLQALYGGRRGMIRLLFLLVVMVLAAGAYFWLPFLLGS